MKIQCLIMVSRSIENVYSTKIKWSWIKKDKIYERINVHIFCKILFDNLVITICHKYCEILQTSLGC